MIKVETRTVVNLARAIPGERFTFQGQDYTVEALDRYRNDAGRECCAVTVSAFCATCGALYEHTTRRRPKWLPKNCGRDHRPTPVHAKPTRQSATSSQGEPTQAAQPISGQHDADREAKPSRDPAERPET
ncbi:MAG: hypothetical protein EOL90_11285 [Spartobacteria bacterium]|nr:hypothetical protein [Spartobacteria bacterium]